MRFPYRHREGVTPRHPSNGPQQFVVVMQPAVDQVAHAAILGGDPPAYIGVGVSEVLYACVRRDAEHIPGHVPGRVLSNLLAQTQLRLRSCLRKRERHTR